MMAKVPKVAPRSRFSASTVAAVTVASCAVAVSHWIAGVVDGISSIVVAAAIGLLAGNTVRAPVTMRHELGRLMRPALRVGVGLVGARLLASDIAALGGVRLIGIVGVVAATFGVTVAVGRALGLRRDFTLLIATGFSICGVSAIAAADSVLAADDDEVVTAMTLVTICGTAAVIGLPMLRGASGLTDPAFGAWIGGSVHDVGQVVAAASTAGSAGLAVATVVKLTRVLLLAPVISGLSVCSGTRSTAGGRKRPPLVPPVVVGFLVMAAARTSGVIPPSAVRHVTLVAELLLGAALFSMAFNVHVRSLRGVGRRPFLLAAAATGVASMSAFAMAVVGWQ